MAKTHKGILQRPPILPYLDLQIQGHVFVLKSGGGIVKVVVGLRERGHGVLADKSVETLNIVKIKTLYFFTLFSVVEMHPA